MQNKHGNFNQDHESRIIRLECVIENINNTLIRIENRQDNFEKRMEDGFESIHNRIDNLDKKMDSGFTRIDNRIWTNFLWSVGGFAGILGLLAHSLHWI